MEKGINLLINSTMETLNSFLNGSTVIGKAIEVANNETVIPVSRISFGIAAAGGEYSESSPKIMAEYPYTGGGGAGATITPVCFLVLNEKGAKLLKIDNSERTNKWIELLDSTLDKLL